MIKEVSRGSNPKDVENHIQNPSYDVFSKVLSKEFGEPPQKVLGNEFRFNTLRINLMEIPLCFPC